LYGGRLDALDEFDEIAESDVPGGKGGHDDSW